MQETYLDTSKYDLLVELMIIRVIAEDVHSVHATLSEEVIEASDQVGLLDPLDHVAADRGPGRLEAGGQARDRD